MTAFCECLLGILHKFLGRYWGKKGYGALKYDNSGKSKAVKKSGAGLIFLYTHGYILSYNISYVKGELIIMADWIVVVDDDVTNLQMAGIILSKNKMRVTAFKAARLLLDFLRTGNRPDLILLDIRMPEIDGFEALGRVRELEKEMGIKEIPIIFLTANESDDTETRGLALGAMDFIKKPFVPDVLIMRVRHILELVRLQSSLAAQVEEKAHEYRELSLQVVQAMADAIDVKDAYTNGHSRRVALYSRNIAARMGFPQRRQDDIYVMGLLHDIGKIGVPNEVINKPSKLNEEEYALIKTHPETGDRILSNIKALPALAVGARCHHERYDGGGYPDGLSGEEIPEAARIIAVADAYDAMSSKRSYRDKLPQDVVRSEIENGKGTQFDPVFADVMLEMIDADKDYEMSER
jgi:response regulator RpfG family c-di-GMP phosphodiesterase